MNSGVTWVRPQKIKFFNEIVELKQITAMTQMRSTTNLSTTLIATVDFTSIPNPKPSKILLRSGTGLVEIMMLLSIVFTPLVIKANLVATETTSQPKTEITKNSNTCGDRHRGDGIFDCNI